MIHVHLKGRMGNQMFQIATAKALALDNNVDFICSKSVSCVTPLTSAEIFRHRETIFRKIKFDHLPINPASAHYENSDFSYSPIKFVSNICLSGYYQSEKYFSQYRTRIIELFSLSEQLEKILNKKFGNLLKKEDTCSVHIRRGDYLKFKDSHNNLSLEYYDKCFEIMGRDKIYVFFSDDIEWCKQNFSNENYFFINTGFDVLDFFIMSNMKSNIIANSSFSWWAAWLNTNKDKRVLAPKVWFGPKNSHYSVEDLIPKTWEKINA